MSLRTYQAQALDEISAIWKKGEKKVLLVLPTGGGKTVIFSEAMKRAAAKGKRSLMAVRGRHLVDQASKRLMRENVPHGVIMAGHWNYRPKELMQICSIDTLLSRCDKGGEAWPEADFIVLDEAHFAVSKGYHKMMQNYKNAYVLGVTATPYVDKPLRHIANEIVRPISFKQLVSDGFLLNARYYAPSIPDLKNVKTSSSTKDYVVEDLASAMQKGGLVGSVVSEWKARASDRLTICFAVNVEHSKNIVQEFKNAGIPAEHVEAETKEKERHAILERLEKGITKVVSNVGILCTGVDLPFVSCIIMNRPTKSYNLYVQQAGRGTRPFPGKTDFLLLDHAGNVLRHNYISHEPEANLDGKEKLKDGSGLKTCSYCFSVYAGFNCDCGFKEEMDQDYSKERKILNIEGSLVELEEMPFEAKVLQEVESLKKQAKAKGYKRGWIYYKLVDKYGEDTAKRFFKQRVVPDWILRKSMSLANG